MWGSGRSLIDNLNGRQIVDYHCHILPHLDDGPKEWEEALKLAERAKNIGIGEIIATPHYEEEAYENTREKILEKVEKFNNFLKKRDVNIIIYPGAEIMMSPSTPQLIQENKVMTIKDEGESVLLELPCHIFPLWGETVLLEIMNLGVSPILAHPERYEWLDMEWAHRMYRKGVRFQINWSSLTGKYGARAKRKAQNFYTQGLASYWGSDAHSAQEMKALGTIKQGKVSVKSRFTLNINGFCKRAFDLIIGTISLVLISPLLIIIVIAIRADSKGPALFSQERIGHNCVNYKCYKFRTMYLGNEKILQAYLTQNPKVMEQWEKYAKLKVNDPRITRTGRILRKFSLDELPQLLNVLKGEMSLVGPRPYLPREKDKMGEYVFDITKTKPGITGLWQVKGRNDIDLQGRLKLDAWYVVNWSFWLDITILLRTVEVVIIGKGAY